jgi:hypothetical protein
MDVSAAFAESRRGFVERADGVVSDLREDHLASGQLPWCLVADEGVGDDRWVVYPTQGVNSHRSAITIVVPSQPPTKAAKSAANHVL